MTQCFVFASLLIFNFVNDLSSVVSCFLSLYFQLLKSFSIFWFLVFRVCTSLCSMLCLVCVSMSVVPVLLWQCVLSVLSFVSPCLLVSHSSQLCSRCSPSSRFLTCVFKPYVSPSAFPPQCSCLRLLVHSFLCSSYSFVSFSQFRFFLEVPLCSGLVCILL